MDVNAVFGTRGENKLEKRFTLCKAVVCIIPECTQFASYPHSTSVFVVIFRTNNFDVQTMNVHC